MHPELRNPFEQELARIDDDVTFIRDFVGPEAAEEFAKLEMRKEGLERHLAEPIFDLTASELFEIQKPRESISSAEAEAIMDEYFFGPEAIAKVWDVHLERQQIPQIPFSREELERALELGQFLILRIDASAEGEPLTVDKMDSILTPQFIQRGKGRSAVFYPSSSTSQARYEEDYRLETPTPGWALVGSVPVQDSIARSYLDQTGLIAAYLEKLVFEGNEVPINYCEAIEEFRTQEPALRKLVEHRPHDEEKMERAADLLAQLKLTQLVRPSLAEAVYDNRTYTLMTGKDMMVNNDGFTRNRSRKDQGQKAQFWGFTGNGAIVSWDMHPNIDTICALFSRTH